jgi:protein involved in polysaccharide export with SLBB domain
MVFGVRNGILLLAAVCVLACGCAMTHQDDLRMTRYHPREKSSRMAWLEKLSPPASTNRIVSPPAVSGPRALRVGDKVLISRRGIPREDEIRDVVDEKGEVNLDLIGSVRIDGKTTSEAEKMIEDAYIQGGFFKNINIVVIGQDDEYYVRGEVMRPGRYPLSVSMTLMRAVTAAGGFTDYADPKSIDIFRGDKATRVDAKKIQSLEADDPGIRRDDMIVVGRKWIL